MDESFLIEKLKLSPKSLVSNPLNVSFLVIEVLPILFNVYLLASISFKGLKNGSINLFSLLKLESSFEICRI